MPQHLVLYKQLWRYCSVAEREAVTEFIVQEIKIILSKNRFVCFSWTAKAEGARVRVDESACSAL